MPRQGQKLLRGFWPADGIQDGYPNSDDQIKRVPVMTGQQPVQWEPTSSANGRWEVMMYEEEPMLYEGDWMYYWVED